MALFDFFKKNNRKHIQNNLFNIQDDPSLKKLHTIPDISDVLKGELSNLYMQALVNMQNKSMTTITEEYTISLLKSYYDNAKIVPMCIVDEIVKQVNDASYGALGKAIYTTPKMLKEKVLEKIYHI